MDKTYLVGNYWKAEGERKFYLKLVTNVVFDILLAPAFLLLFSFVPTVIS